MRHPFRTARPRLDGDRVSLVRESLGGARHVADRPPRVGDPGERAGTGTGRRAGRLLWRRVSHARPLTLAEAIAERVAGAPPIEVDEPGLFWAAVALILAPDPDALLLIRRAQRSGDPWSGHMGLPGGRRNPGDSDLLETAIRETAEEVGVSLERAHLVGALSDVAPRTPVLPPIAVRPFLFRLPARPALLLNQEVAVADWVPLAAFVPDARQDVAVEVAGSTRTVSAFVTPHGIVWGMTERILSELIPHLR